MISVQKGNWIITYSDEVFGVIFFTSSILPCIAAEYSFALIARNVTV